MATNDVEVKLHVDTSEAEAAIRHFQLQTAQSALDDILVVLDWLGATKTPTKQAEAALGRLRERAKANVPLDVRIVNNP